MLSPRTVTIDHLNDTRLAPYANLRHASARPPGDRFIVEGRMLVERLIASRYVVESVLVEKGHEQAYTSRLGEPTSIYALPREQLKELVGFDFHRGVIACGKRLPLKSIDQFHFAPDDLPIALAAIGISELENLGSLLRSAAGFGIRHVLIGPQTIDPFARRVIRVSMANVLELELYCMDKPSAQLAQLHQTMGIRSVATTLKHDATPLHHFTPDRRPTVLIVGNEADGLRDDVQKAATDRLTIPMRLGTNSLNVAVAAAVFMHQLTSPHRT